MSKHLIQLHLGLDATQTVALLNKSTTAGKEQVQALIGLLEGIQGGVYNAHLNVKLGCDFASKTGTFTGDPSADETVTIGGVVFTAKASGATGNQYNIGANVTAHAANLAAAINASSSVNHSILATSALGVITITSKIPGKVGNLITLAESTSNFTWAGSVLASGDVDTDKDFQLGKTKETT